MPHLRLRPCFVPATALLSLSLVLAACGANPSPGATAPSPSQEVEAPPATEIAALAIPTNGQEYIIRNRCSGKVLEIAGSSLNNRGNAQQWAETGADNQRWILEATSSGYYKVIAKHSNKVLEVDGAGTANGSNVQQFSYGNYNNQQWRFDDVGDGYYELSPRHKTSSALDVNSADLGNGVNIQLWTDNTTCAQDWKLEPTAVSYSAPIAIRDASDPTGAPATRTVNGVRYFSGNWESQDPTVPAVNVLTSERVVIEDCNLRSKGDMISSIYKKAHLEIRNCKGYGINPNDTTRHPGYFLHGDEIASVLIENNYFEKTGGIRLARWSPTMFGVQPGDTYIIRYNRAKNIEGRYSNGAGGWQDNFFRTQFVQFDKVTGMAGVEIAWNRMDNNPNESYVEDNINIYRSSGTSTSPIRIRNNLVHGAYGSPVDDGGYSGGGILLGDACDASFPSAYQEASDNTVLNTNRYGIGIWHAQDAKILNNTILNVGKVDMGGATLYTSTDRGIYMRQYCSGTYDAARVASNVASNNRIGWGNPSASNPDGRADEIHVQGSPAIQTGTFDSSNTFWNGTQYASTGQGPITQQMITNAITAWENSAIANNIVVGPR